MTQQQDPNIKYTTPGEWIVIAKQGDEFCEVITETQKDDGDDLVALVSNIADAALIAISKDMLDLIISFQAELNSSKEVIDLELWNERISDVLAKLANEAGEER